MIFLFRILISLISVIIIIVVLNNKSLLGEDALKYFYEAESLYKKNNYKSAVLLYKEAIKINPYFKEAHYRLGVIYIKLGMYNLAVDSLKEAIRIDSKYKPAYLRLGEVYERVKNYKWASWAYNKALDIDITYKPAYLGLARLAVANNKPATAISLYKKILDIDPMYAKAYFGLGRLYEDIYKDKTKAEYYYKYAISYDPKNISYIMTLADFYYDKKDLNSAKYNYSNILKLNPGFKPAIKKLGIIYLELKEYKLAEKLYNKASKLYPRDKIIALGLAYTQRLRLKFKDALRNFDKAYKLSRKDEIITLAYKDILLEDRLAIMPDSPKRTELAKYFFEKAKKYKALGDYQIALFSINSAVELAPLIVEYRLEKVNLLENIFGYHNLTLPQLQKILTLDEENQIAQDKIEKINWFVKNSLYYKYNFSFDDIKLKKPYVLINISNKGKLYPNTEILLKNLLSWFINSRELMDVKFIKIKGRRENPILYMLNLTDREKKKVNYLYYIEFDESNKFFKINSKLINVDNLSEVDIDIIKEGDDKLKEAVSYVVDKLTQTVQKTGRIIKIINDSRVLVNMGRFWQVKEGDIIEARLPLSGKKAKFKIIKAEEKISEASLTNMKLAKYIKEGIEVVLSPR